MKTVTIQEIIDRQEAQRSEVIDNSDRAHSALILANMALEHGN